MINVLLVDSLDDSLPNKDKWLVSLNKSTTLPINGWYNTSKPKISLILVKGNYYIVG
jgi:hypothetical protein